MSEDFGFPTQALFGQLLIGLINARSKRAALARAFFGRDLRLLNIITFNPRRSST